MAGPQHSNFIKKRLQHRFFSSEICRIFKNTLFYRSQVAAFTGLRFPACNFFKNETPAKMFFLWILQIFEEHVLIEHLRKTAPCVYLRILRSFSEHLFYRAPYFKYSYRISTTRYCKKLFHKCFSSILYKNKKQPFEDVKIFKDT